jgi:lipopolysaccharide transport system ATP-binding protein
VASLLEVGTGFHPELTGRENVFLNGTILGMTKAEIRRKFDDIVEFAEIGAFIDTPVKRYSSGMYVRLAFAVAAHLEPEILVVDEVLAVGDAAFQRKCLGKMDDVARDGRTVLFVSHNMGMIERLCRTSILLHQGRMRAMGPTAEITREYLGLAAETALDWRCPAEAGESAQITRVRLCNEAGESLSFVTTACTPCLEIECRVPAGRPDLRLAFSLHDWQERAVFASSPADCDLPGPVEPGIHRYRAMFPGPILMPQRYSISVSLYTAYCESIDHRPHVLRFDAAEVASLANVVGTRVGVLQMPAQWSYETETLAESRVDG